MSEPAEQGDQSELEALRRENRALKRMIHVLTKKDFHFNRDELLAQVGKRGDFVAFLDSLIAKETGV